MSGWASPALARFAALDSPILVDLNQASWVASLLNFGRLFGAVIGATTTNYLGTKCSISVTLFPIAIGWIIIAVADSVEWLYASRLLSGVGLGMSFSTFPLYIGEISMPEIRGALISLAMFGGPCGQVIASICGSYLSLTMASISYLVMCLVCMALFFWLPESPHHLMKVGQPEAAKRSIHWYRAGKDVQLEFQAVEKFVACKKTTTFVSMLQEFNTSPVRRATTQVIALFTFMQICGLNSVVFYMETILNKANFTLISPSDVVIYVNVCGTGAAALSIFLIDSYGRRFLLLISSSGITISMTSLMIYFLLIDLKIETANIQWIPMASMFLFIISFSVGLMPVPSTILSETFPANIKCIAACIASLTSAGMAFLSAKTYQPMVDLMGEKYVFLTYAICSFIVIPYVLFVMRETKGKTLQQIQDELISK